VTSRKLASFLLVAILCAAGAAVLVASIRPTQAHATASSTSDTTTPLWSARRVPSLLIRIVETNAQNKAGAALTQQLTQIVAPVHACVAVDGPTGALARVDTDLALAPASTMKLLTATTAIDRLGPDHRFTTRAYTDDAGNLIVVGSGDPRLATPDYIDHQHAQARTRDAAFTPLSDLADAIVAAGVHDVSGSLVVDDHIHDTLRFLPVWKPVYAQEGDIGSIGALVVDSGFDATTGTPVADPALTTGSALATLLEARGVTIGGGVVRGVAAPDAHEVAHVDSPPLSAIVGEMLTNSNNFTAEELVRDVAVTDGNTPATTDAGTLIVAAEMKRLGVPTAGLVMHDGSGLSPDDRVNCATMLGVIDLASRPKFAAIDQGLAVAGSTGTLADRFIGDPLAGKLRAKTGSISGVVGLVGLIDGPDNLHFAFLANGDFSAGAGAQLQADVARAVGATPDVRVRSDLVPAP
jgi:D-alanyl-D-alanine carboxypeptidase/D-alanyl-D-alanine-endopeptidase (penicillin-binding protein 4)